MEQTLIDFVSFSDVYPIDKETIDKTIDLRRKYRIKLPDAMIAATAIVNNLTLITHNIKDFQKITELQMIDSYTIEL